MNKQVDLSVHVPVDAIEVPMVVVIYTKGKVEPGLIVGGVQQNVVRDAEIHASVKLLTDPSHFDPQTLLMFAQTARQALDAMEDNVRKMVQALASKVTVQ